MRCATSAPMRPRPTTPRVFSASSTPGASPALPLTVLQRGVGLRDVARGGEEEAAGQLGRGHDVRGGGVDDHHAGLGGGGDVDVVQADAGSCDDLELLRGGVRPPRRPWWPNGSGSRRRRRSRAAARRGPRRCSAGSRSPGPGASTVAGDSSSAMSTTGFELTCLQIQCGRPSRRPHAVEGCSGPGKSRCVPASFGACCRRAGRKVLVAELLGPLAGAARVRAGRAWGGPAFLLGSLEPRGRRTTLWA